MTMHTNKGTRIIKVECDVCADILDTETSNFQDACVALDEAGWRYKKINGVNRHICDHKTCTFNQVKD